MGSENGNQELDKLIDITFRFIQQQIIDQVPKENTLAELRLWNMPQKTAEVYYNQTLHLFESEQIPWDREPLVEGESPSQQIINELLPEGFNNPTLLPTKDFFLMTREVFQLYEQGAPQGEIVAFLKARDYSEDQALSFYDYMTQHTEVKNHRMAFHQAFPSTMLPGWKAKNPILDKILMTIGYLLLASIVIGFITPILPDIPPALIIVIIGGFFLLKIWRSWTKKNKSVEELIEERLND